MKRLFFLAHLCLMALLAACAGSTPDAPAVVQDGAPASGKPVVTVYRAPT